MFSGFRRSRRVIRVGDTTLEVTPVYRFRQQRTVPLPRSWRTALDPVDPWVVWETSPDGSLRIRLLTAEESAALHAQVDHEPEPEAESEDDDDAGE